jgi:hypothetical protein
MVSDTFPKSSVASIMGIGGAAGAIGSMIMARYVGQVLESVGTYVPVFLWAGGAYLVALLIVHLLLPRLDAAAPPASACRAWNGCGFPREPACIVAQFSCADQSDVGIELERQKLLFHAEPIRIAPRLRAALRDQGKKPSRIGEFEVFSPASAFFTSEIVRIIDTPKSESDTPTDTPRFIENL